MSAFVHRPRLRFNSDLTWLSAAVLFVCTSLQALALDIDDTGAGSIDKGDFSANPLDEQRNKLGTSRQPTGTQSLSVRWSNAIANDNTTLLTSLLQSHNAPAELVKLTSQNGKDALMVACKKGEYELAKQLVATGANINAVTLTGGTPFMFAVLGNELAIAKWLFNQGVDINAQGSNGWSAVTIASAKGFAEMLAWLVAIGVNVNAADVYQFSPLMRAVDNGHANAVHILLGVPGIEIDVQDEAKNTALHYAVANNRRDLVELLLDSGARSDIRNRMGQTAATMARDEAALSALIPIQ